MSVFIHSKKRTDDLFNDMCYNKTIDWKIKFIQKYL